MDLTSYDTIQFRLQDNVCFIQLNRPRFQNTINDEMVTEFRRVLQQCKGRASVLVLEGNDDFFCMGADFQQMAARMDCGVDAAYDPEPLYDAWLEWATGPYVTISHVRGKANAGGVGFAAASDIVIADQSATFSLSELLFGLFPACVIPFLIRRIGYQRTHYMTLTTQPISADQALAWGLADSCQPNSAELLRRHLLRLKRLDPVAIQRYKSYLQRLYNDLGSVKELALDANREVFGDSRNQKGIRHFVETGEFPWLN